MDHKTLLKDMLARVAIASGIVYATRALLWRDRVAILLYHDPDPQTLDAHLAYLKTICDLIPLEDLHKPGNGRPRAVITLDDGHAGNAQLLPVFVKHGVRPTICLCSRIVGRPRTHWWLYPGAEHAGIERLKRETNDQRLAELEVLGFHQDVDDRATGLTFEQIDAMRVQVDFQSHTCFHPILTRCSDDECGDEIRRSKREIAELVGSCEHFAYPNGNYGTRELEYVKAAGYKTARTCDVGWNDMHTDPFRLRTLIISDHAPVRWFALQLTGIPRLIAYWRAGGGLRGRFPQF